MKFDAPRKFKAGTLVTNGKQSLLNLVVFEVMGAEYDVINLRYINTMWKDQMTQMGEWELRPVTSLEIARLKLDGSL